MPDITEFTPVVQETIETIRARLDADINAGLDPADPRWTDTVEGSVYWDLTQIFALEAERLWDMIGTELPASIFPSYAWGVFIDEHALTYGLIRKPAIAATGTIRFTGTAGSAITTGTQVGTEPVDPDDESIVYQTTASGLIPGIAPATGFIDLPAQAVAVGVVGNVAVGVVSLLLSPVAGISSVANVTAMASGEDQESDADLQARVLVEIASTVGAGTASDYVRWSLSYPGVGNVTVQPTWAGGGTVRVIVTDAANQPVSAGVIAGLQTLIDPAAFPGAGQGLAPIGAIVTVATPTYYYVNVAATIVHDSGYTLDGTSGTIATRAAIVSAITNYVNTLQPGFEVVINRIEFAALSVPGVHDITGTSLAGFLPDVVVGHDPRAFALAGTPADRALLGTNLPVPSGSVARIVLVTLT